MEVGDGIVRRGFFGVELLNKVDSSKQHAET